MKKSYKAIKEEEVFGKGGVVKGYQFKSGRREEIKKKTIKAIVDNLGYGWRGCTLQVLHERTGYSKTNLKAYLSKLMSVGAVRKELDMYFLEENRFKVRTTFLLPSPFYLVWLEWHNLPEYNVPDVLEPDKKGSAVKLTLRGHKPVGDAKTVKRKLREYRKKHAK